MNRKQRLHARLALTVPGHALALTILVDHYNRVARYHTPPGSQTGLFVPEWGKLFVAVRAQDEQSAEIRVYQAH